MPANGKLVILPPTHPRMKYESSALSKYSDVDLMDVVKQHELWRDTGEFRLQYTICRDLAGSEIVQDLFEACDAVCREVARRAYLKR